MEKNILETKFKEVVFRTDLLEVMKGNYLAERVLRGWSEDFVDEDTGNVVEIQRNEILFERGLLLDNDILTQVNFYLQSGDIKDVLVSNQQRKGVVVTSSESVYCVTIHGGKKKTNYYLYANSVGLALNIITDFLEQKIVGAFSILSIKEMGYSNLISLDDAEDLEKEFYKIEVDVIYEETDSYEQIFILQATNVDEAKDLIIRYISLKLIANDKERPFEVTVLSAKTIPCNNIVDYHFVKEYLESN